MKVNSPVDESMAELSRDVSFLGRVLGDVLREQGGDELFGAVEGLRLACREWRQDGTAQAQREVLARVEATSLELAHDVVRAFRVYFHLINMAEENHRLRRLARRETSEYPAPRQGSIGQVFASLRSAGVTDEEAAQLLDDFRVRPVFTAHPTEARRMTLLRNLQRISECVERICGQHLAPRERQRWTDRLYAEVTDLWQTNELRTRQQTVLDEVRNALYLFEESVFEVTAQVYRDMDEALGRWYPSLRNRTLPFLTFGSWIGGDRDGNPNVTAQVTEETLRLQKAMVLSKYITAVQHLYEVLTPSSEVVGVSAELQNVLNEMKREFGSAAEQLDVRLPSEQYRQMLVLMQWKLQRTYHQNGMRWGMGQPEPPGGKRGPMYHVADEFLADLQLLASSLDCHGGRRIRREYLQDLIWQVRVFGFFLARLDVRQHRDRHLSALDELMGPEPRFGELSNAERIQYLRHGFSNPPDLSDRTLSPETAETVEVFRAIGRLQSEMGSEAVNTYIVSMTTYSSDLLAILWLAYVTGLFEPDQCMSRLRVVPLFETEEDLSKAPDMMRQLYADPLYRVQLRAWNNEQEIMLGYSDSDKDAGYMTSNWWLYRAQQELTRLSSEAGVKVTFFHGRGGAIGRGGGPLQRAILGQPAETIGGRLKVTEQGEVLFTRYANPGIAHRHLEQVCSAVLQCSAGALSTKHRDLSRWEMLASEMSERASSAYRQVVQDDHGFLTFFEEGTPLRSIVRLRLASRPPRRQPGSLRLGDLRAIPWVFAWIQSRWGVPGWYGMGSALEDAILRGELSELQTMYRGWPFFHWLIDAAQIALGKADLAIARQYASLVPDESLRNHYLEVLDEEFRRTVRTVNAVVGQDELLDSWPVLQRSIALRNPYVDPMSYLQVRAIREVRRTPDGPRGDLLRSIIDRSVPGIAAGLQNTG